MNGDPNPYTAPSETSDEIGGVEGYVVESLRRYRSEGGPTVGSLLGARWCSTHLALAAGAAWILWSGNWPRLMGWLLIGYLIGSVTTTLQTWWIVQKVWPIQAKYVDWTAVDRYGERPAS